MSVKETHTIYTVNLSCPEHLEAKQQQKLHFHCHRSLLATARYDHERGDARCNRGIVEICPRDCRLILLTCLSDSGGTESAKGFSSLMNSRPFWVMGRATVSSGIFSEESTLHSCGIG